MKKYILAIDQGTTGTTTAIIDSKTLKIIDTVNYEFPQLFPKTGYVEHDLDDIWNSVIKAVKSIISKMSINANDIISIGITNQRETVTAFDNNGVPIENAIVWQDTRTSNKCNKLIESNLEKFISDKTGLLINPYFSATKIHWLLNNSKKIANAKTNNNLKFGTIDTFLLYKLTSGKSFYTEATNASRTMLMDISKCQWDNDILKLFNISSTLLPKILPSFSNFGKTKGLDFLPDGIPITGILGDQQAALFGQKGQSKGDLKCTYGTGAFILLNTGHEIVRSKCGLLSTVAYKTENETVYALEGSSYIAGAAVQWLRDNLKIIDKNSEIEQLANEANDISKMKEIIFLPFFTGIGSPYWRPEASASLLGLRRSTGKNEIARAVLEGIALSINDLISSMSKDCNYKFNFLNVDGGASKNNLLMQIQADISALDIRRPETIETTVLGAAYASAVGLGIIHHKNLPSSENFKSFKSCSNNSNYYQSKKDNWKRLINILYNNQ